MLMCKKLLCCLENLSIDMRKPFLLRLTLLAEKTFTMLARLPGKFLRNGELKLWKNFGQNLGKLLGKFRAFRNG